MEEERKRIEEERRLLEERRRLEEERKRLEEARKEAERREEEKRNEETKRKENEEREMKLREEVRARQISEPSPQAQANADIIPPTAQAEYLQLTQQFQQVQTLIRQDFPEKTEFGKQIHLSLNQIACSRKSVSRQIETLSSILNKTKQNQLVHTYCLNLVAQKLVAQSGIQISRKSESAFAFAVVAVMISAKFSKLMPLILVHLAETCPYVIPMYPPKRPQQSREDYFVNTLKYKKKVDNPKGIEEFEPYSERMAGAIYLYASICVVQVGAHHTHPIKHAWVWLARILNMTPRKITPSLLLAFLEHSAYFMHKTYGRQFAKLLQFIKEDYLRRLPAGTEAAKTRLEIFLSNRSQLIERPQGLVLVTEAREHVPIM